MKFVQLEDDLIVNLLWVVRIERDGKVLRVYDALGKVEIECESEEECLELWRMIGERCSLKPVEMSVRL